MAYKRSFQPVRTKPNGNAGGDPRSLALGAEKSPALFSRVKVFTSNPFAVSVDRSGVSPLRIRGCSLRVAIY